MAHILSDLHIHTTCCDGKSTAAQMAAAACAQGYTDLGFSGHYPTAFRMRYCLKDVPAYEREILRLRQEYAGQMRIWLGTEYDFYSDPLERQRYDYIIGSQHFIYHPGTDHYWSVDGLLPECTDSIEQCFHGDGYAWCEEYYAQLARNAVDFDPDVIGHFDILSKNNKDNILFDEQHPRYQTAALDALHACLALDKVFELNSGCISRGYRQQPYLAPFLLRELRQHQARVTLASDAHSTLAIGCAFDLGIELMRQAGFTSLWVWRNGEFVEQGL